jgi:DNA repair exonuclease SbcCD ATPase subunit
MAIENLAQYEQYLKLLEQSFNDQCRLMRESLNELRTTTHEIQTAEESWSKISDLFTLIEQLRLTRREVKRHRKKPVRCSEAF